jgi:hypothetical protein
MGQVLIMPSPNNSQASSGAVIPGILGWLQQPLNPKGDWWDWFLFLGLTIIFVMFWIRVLNTIGTEL